MNLEFFQKHVCSRFSRKSKGSLAVIGGPCSIESEEQAVRIAREVKDAAENQPLFAVEELRGLSVFTYPAQ